MRFFRVSGAIAFLVILGTSGLEAQSLNGMSLNGSTGLYSVPSGRTGWERSSSFGLDLGYHMIVSDGYTAHIPKFSMSLVNSERRV